MASVLRPWPVENTRTRPDSFGGTSTTCSPSASRRMATCRPIPLQPSTAQTRSGQCFAARSMAAYPEASVEYRPPPSKVSSGAITSMVTDRLCGSMPMTTRVTLVPPCSSRMDVEQGGQRYFELCRPLLSLSLLSSARPAQAK